MYLLISITFIVIVVGGTIIGVFNRFALNRNKVKDSWSNIDVALRRRHDLIPNLIATVRGYAQHEKETFNRVTEARNVALMASGADINQQVQAENALQRSLRGLFALSEAYPDLKANLNFLDLQQKLDHIEENLERSRRFYNSMVRNNNTYGESFPGVFFKGLFHYQPFEFFEANQDEREIVQVDFN